LGKKLFLITGNGFSIDFLRFIDNPKDIDLVNLFRRGSEVPWPGSGEPGFLSFKHCPNLWNLGARPDMGSEESMLLIEDIITCVNVDATYAQIPKSLGGNNRPNDIYFRAYQELLEYFRNIFVFYNNLMPEIPNLANQWPWLEFIKIAHESTHYEEITIVTYNYDIWLERLLIKNSIPFNVNAVGPQLPYCKINIIKPHGSISFSHKFSMDRDSYDIRYDRNMSDYKAADFELSHSNLNIYSSSSALIPPAGESGRMKHSWASELRSKATERAGSLGEDDELVVCGLSYWHVDRAELDELIVGCNPNINVTMVNPKPNRTISAVLTSIFSNFVTYSKSETLKERIICQTS
jgi:hypothetical protein